MDAGADLARRFAEISGADYVPCAYNVGRAWSSEEKFRLPLKFMNGSGRPILSIDADVLCIGSDNWIEALGEADFAGVRNTQGEFNVGSFMFRDTPAVIALFLRSLRRLPDEQRIRRTPYCDQILLNHEVANSGISYRWINRRWNDYGRAAGRLDGPTQIKAFHDLGNTSGPSVARKLELMNDWRAKHAAAV